MIKQVMDSINNHFVNDWEHNSYEIVSDGISGTFSCTYLVGMYILIEHSYLNDGVYEITGVTSSKITVDATLKAENTNDSMTLYALTPPADFISIVTDISNFDEKGLGVNSESIDDYSVTYEDDGSWQSVYKNKLNQYRRVYTDLVTNNYYKYVKW